MQLNKHDIFISYSREDLALVRQIKREIESSTNSHCWMDLNGSDGGVESGSFNFAKAIVDAIENCKVFLFMLSEKSQNSFYAVRELNYAYGEKDALGIHVVIINIDNCRITNKEFKFLLGLVDTISWKDISQHDKLIKDIISWKATIKTKEDLLAHKIAHLYLDKFPRPNWYGVEMRSTEDDSEGTFYHKLNDKEFEILRGYVNRPEEYYDVGLEEWLEGEEQKELIDKLLDIHSSYALNLLSDIDLDHPRKYTRLSMRFQKFDGTISDTSYIGIDLTDNEYVDLLSDLLKSDNHYSLNMMVYKKPEIAQRIMSHIVSVFLDGLYDFAEPFLCDLYELKSVAKSILDPFEDKLQLFESEDEEIRNFVARHQINPAGAGEEIFSDYSKNDFFHCVLNFDGPYMYLYQEGTKRYEEWYDIDKFKFDARIALKKFGLEKPEELFPYLKEHYNSRDCLSRIREFLTGS